MNENDGANATAAASSPPPSAVRGVADGGDRRDDRAGRDLPERDGVEELGVGHPVVGVHGVALHQRDDHEAAAVGERADLERRPASAPSPPAATAVGTRPASGAQCSPARAAGRRRSSELDERRRRAARARATGRSARRPPPPPTT